MAIVKRPPRKLATTDRLNEIIDVVNAFGPDRPLPVDPLFDLAGGGFVPIQVSTHIARGRYRGKIGIVAAANKDIGATTALAIGDVSTFAASDNCEVWDASTLGVVLAKFHGYKIDGTPVFLEPATKSARDLRYNSTSHQAQTTEYRFPQNDSDWAGKIQFTSCAGGASLTGEGNRSLTGVGELLGTKQPLTNSGAMFGGTEGRL